ncbi:hypothetical protein NE237_032699 [Protea cynaroides]|uniref:Uncharacterized protein n=1 Tax=Protea cynaroides TaxID=273540 RepID=A0A9Q0L3L5_9MAGN|nr:hypothetical protein NE237_032699 [Protea cynaroides]
MWWSWWCRIWVYGVGLKKYGQWSVSKKVAQGGMEDRWVGGGLGLKNGGDGALGLGSRWEVEWSTRLGWCTEVGFGWCSMGSSGGSLGIRILHRDSLQWRGVGDKGYRLGGQWHIRVGSNSWSFFYKSSYPITIPLRFRLLQRFKLGR